MKQHDKLQAALRDHYDHIQYPFDENEWNKAAALFKRRSRRRKLLLLFSLLLLLSPLLLLLPFSEDQPLATISAGASRPGMKEMPAAKSETVGSKPIRTSTQENTARRNAVRRSNTLVQAGTDSPSTAAIVNGKVPEGGEPVFQAVAPASITQVSPLVLTMPPDNGTEDKAPATDIQQSPAGYSTKTDSAGHLSADLKPSSDNVIRQHDSTTEEEAHTAAILPQEPVKADTLSNDLAKADSSSKIAATMGREGPYLEAGGNLYAGWKNNSGKEAAGISLVAGLGYMSLLHEKIGLSAGLYYNQVPHLSSSTVTSRISTYQYGEQSQVTSITPVTLYYLSMPLRLHYFLDDRNGLGGSVDFAYLMNVKARVSTYEELPGLTRNHKTFSQDGYFQGFSWYDAQVAVFYQYRFYSHLSLHSEIFFGLKDVKDDNFFGRPGRERNAGLKCTIIYRLKHKP